MFLSDTSIKRPIMISMLLLVFVVFGGLAYFSLSLDLTPEVDIPFVTVQTVYAGAGPKEVETQVSKRIEDAVSTIGKIDTVQSFSMDSVSLVMIKFKMGKDGDLATQEVKDKIDVILNDLPSDAERPVAEKFDLRAEPVIDVTLSGTLDIKELYELADKRLKDRFSQIEGVARVDLVGGREREIRVELDNRVVFENSISLLQLGQLLKMQNMDMPGGQFKQKSQEYSVRFEGEFDSLDTIRELEIPTAFGPKKLGNIAHIRDTGADIRERTTFYNNVNKLKMDNVVLLSILKSVDGNSVDIARKLREELPKIEADLPAGCTMSIVKDKSVFIQSSVEDTLSNIFLGVLLTALVLLFFLHDIRSTIIVALAMPFSIISTFMLMRLAGFSLNIMSLMGLSTAVGVLVSNSVVVLENIFRHKKLGKTRKEAAAKGTSEIVVAVLASTMTNIVVFLPIASMSSMAGQFFKEFALTVTFATIFSLLVSFTLTPMLASLLLPDTADKKHRIGEALEKLFAMWELWYGKLLAVVLKNRLRSLGVVALSILMFFLSFFSAGRVGFEFMPMLDEGDIQIQVELPQGYNLEETGKMVTIIERRLKKYPEVKHVLSQLGSISSMDVGTNLAKMSVKLVNAQERQLSGTEAANKFIRDLSDIPNAVIRVAAVSSLSGSDEAPLLFYLQGQDSDKLEQYKKEIVERITDTPGLVNLTTSSRSGKPEIKLLPDRKKLSDAGLTIYDLAMALRGAVEGLEATQYKDGGEEYALRVVMKKESVDTPEEVGNIAVVSQAGTFRLSQLAEVKFADGYSKILHKDKYKSISIEGYPAPGFALGEVADGMRARMADLELPGGYRLRWGGDVEMMEDTAVDMLGTFVIAILLTYMLLAAILESLTQPLMILGTVPLAMIGVFISLDLTGKTMNIMSMMAIIMLLGIVVNNAILLLDYTNILRKKGKGVTEALLQACPTKLKPILMATIAIMLGMLPMAMGIGEAGREFRQPMGIVSIGGLLVSAVLTLLVIPAIYNLTSGRKRQAK
ncbi:MAG: efflux RND transporter permease subunit [bacterium]|nr:efflux RND transporter permease subunit [bacterium]